DRVNIVCEVCAIFQADAIAASGHLTPPQSGLINLRILVLKVVSLELGVARIVFPVIDVGFKSNGDTAASPVIEPEPAFNVVGDREGKLGEGRRPPRAQVGW